MLSKLLSNIANSEETSLPEGLSGKVKKGDGNKGSKQVFQSLLQALQNDESADNKQLLTLTGSEEQEEQSESEDSGGKAKIMGGALMQTDTGESEVNGQPVAQTILERLQQQLKNRNADTEQSAEVSEESSSEGKAVDSERNILSQKEQEVSEKIENNNEEAGSETSQLKSKEATTNDTEQQTEQAEKSKQSDKQPKEELIREVNDTDGKDQQKTEGSSKEVEQTETKTVDDQQSSESSKRAVNSEQKVPYTADANAEKNVEGRVNSEKIGSSEQEKKIKTETEDKAPNKSGQGKKQGQQVATTQSDKTPVHPKEDTEQKTKETREESRELNVDSENKQKVDRQTASSGDKFSGDILRSNRTSEVPRQGEQAATGTKNQKEQDEQSLTRETSGAKTAKTELNDQQKKVIDSFFQKNTTAPGKGFEIKNVKTEKDQKTKENTENEKDLAGSANKSRNRLFNRLGILNTENSKLDKSLSPQNFSGISTGDSQTSTEEQKIIWEKHTAETVEVDDEKEMKTSNSSSSFRLGQMPVTNASLRQKILPGLTQSVQKAADGAKKSPGNWQKHNFVLDDGKKIQLSVRESKGILQVKMGSMNSDLSKLLQQNAQQIRDHLKQEFGSDIDLQFENHDQGEESAFSEGSETSDQKRNYRDRLSGNEVTSERTGEVASTTVRNFGYNQMEWTA